MVRTPPENPAHITTCISHELKEKLNETRGDHSLSAWVRVILEEWAKLDAPYVSGAISASESLEQVPENTGPTDIDSVLQ